MRVGGVVGWGRGYVEEGVAALLVTFKTVLFTGTRRCGLFSPTSISTGN